MKQQQLTDYQEITWQNARPLLVKANAPQELITLIDAINPNGKYSFIKATYPYGTKILDNGVIQLANKTGKFVKLHDTSIPQAIQQKLLYSPIPAAIILHNSIEVFVEPENRIVPLSMLPQGSLFGLWETFDEFASSLVERLWNMTAGARTLFFLPSISDKYGHKRLANEFNIYSPVPAGLFDEWHTFIEIANHPAANCDWTCEVLFFTSPWFKEPGKSAAWHNLRAYLIETAFNQETRWRRKNYFDLVTETFSLAVVKRNLKPTPNQINFIKHLFDIGHGVLPGLRPAIDDSCAPISLLQQIYLEVYKLEKYAPIMMHPTMHLLDEPIPMYCSLPLPTQLDYAPKRNAPKVINELRDIIRIHETMLGKLAHEDRPIFKQAKAFEYHYFHSEADERAGIQPTCNILNYDPVMASLVHHFSDRQFAEKSTFLRGCVLVKTHP